MKAKVAELEEDMAAAMEELESIAARHGVVLVGIAYPRSAVVQLVDDPPNDKCVLFALQPEGPEFAPDVCGKLFDLSALALGTTASYLKETEADELKH